VFDNTISPLFRQILRYEQIAQPCVSFGYAAHDFCHKEHGKNGAVKMRRRFLAVSGCAFSP